MDIYDVTSAAYLEDENTIAMALFDNRYNSILLVRPAIKETVNEETGEVLRTPCLTVTDPDGAERLYWHEKFGMIDAEEFQREAAALEPVSARQRLYELLGKEFKGGGR